MAGWAGVWRGIALTTGVLVVLGIAAVATPATPATPAAPVARLAGPAACRTAQVVAWVGVPGSGVAGGVYYELQLSNVSSRTCSLRGFPGVAAVTAAGRHLGDPAGHDHASPPTTVVLPPGATAHAVLRVTDVAVLPPSTCRPVRASGLVVSPPQQRAGHVVAFPIRACARKGVTYLSVRVVRPHAGIPGYSQ